MKYGEELKACMISGTLSMIDKDILFKEISDAFKPVLNKSNRYNADTITDSVRGEVC